jgi:hypothetical protein
LFAIGCLLLVVLPLLGVFLGGFLGGLHGAELGAAIGFVIAAVLCGISVLALVKAAGGVRKR